MNLYSTQWKTADGNEIEVSQMETHHIQNALAMLKRKGYVGPSTVEFYLSCPEPHGDGAQLAFGQEFDAMCNAPVSPFVDLFEAELKRRRSDHQT